MPRMTNYFRTSHKILESEEFNNMSLSAKYLYIRLCKLRNRFLNDSDEADNNHEFIFRSLAKLSQETRLSKTAIVNAKKELKDHGFIKIEKDKETHNGADKYLIGGFEFDTQYE